MLEMDDSLRTILIAIGALGFDEDKQEIFIGLTVAESKFFLSYSRMPPHERDLADDLVFNQIQHRHLLARTRRFWDGQ